MLAAGVQPTALTFAKALAKLTHGLSLAWPGGRSIELSTKSRSWLAAKSHPPCHFAMRRGLRPSTLGGQCL